MESRGRKHENHRKTCEFKAPDGRSAYMHTVRRDRKIQPADRQTGSKGGCGR